MNKVELSNAYLDSWDNTESGGVFKLFVYPKKWWRIKDWRLALAFMKDFYVCFVKGE